MDQADFTPYAHSAAGHDGMSSNASGSLIIKPCTQAEIDFYELAKDHPEFQAHMPTYMGKLTLSDDPQVHALVRAPSTQNGSAVLAASGSLAMGLLDGIDSGSKDPKPEHATLEKSKEWVPSGGKKLSTGLGIVLENVTTGFDRPNVIDLKLGSRLWADDAPDAKRQKLDQVAAETTTGTLGFRIAGMKVWLGDAITNSDATKVVHTETKEGYKSFNKFYGRSLTADTISEAFIHYLGGRTSSAPALQFRRKRAILLLKRLLRELSSIEYVLEHEESRMYSASILVVIEGDDPALESALEAEKNINLHEDDDEDFDEDDMQSDDEESVGPRVMEVRLIDFAHAAWTPGTGPDNNALKGVRNIKRIVEGLIEASNPT